MAREPGVRIAVTAGVAVVAAGLASVLALSFISAGCHATGCDVEALLLLGLLVPWATTAGIIAGRAAYEWRFGAKVAVALLLAWLSAHFLWPGAFFGAYVRLVGVFGGGLDAWAMLLWLLMAAAMTGSWWLIGNLAERVR